MSEPVATICTVDVYTVGLDAQLDDLMRIMTEHRIRHLPVVVDGSLRGILSIGDIVKKRIDELESERSALSDYISGAR